MLNCDNVAAERGGGRIFEHVGFCLEQGGFLLVKGANGSGKTTLLRILCGLAAPAEGSVTWHGENAHKSEHFRRELLYIGHANAIKTELTVRENLSFWAKHYDREMLLKPAMRYFGLEGKEDVPCRHLSAGWRRRVALSRLLLSPASIWLLDEPTNFLDQEAVALVGSLIESRIQHEGMVIAASHAMQSSFPAHVLLMEDFAPCRG